MNGRCALLLVLFLSICSISAFAGSPTIGVYDPVCNTGSKTNYDFLISGDKTSDITFNNFTAQNGGGVFTFCNQTHSIWNSVAFATTNFNSMFPLGTWDFNNQRQTTPGPEAPVTCSVAANGLNPQAFLTCEVTITSTEFLMKFSGTTDPGVKPKVSGVGQNQTMTVNLNDNVVSTCTPPGPGCGSWKFPDGRSVTFAGGANIDPGGLTPPVPEPTSLLLLGSGFVGLVLLRRKRK